MLLNSYFLQIGPHGNTVLLSNSARDMQQVLLAGGPYPADGLVSSLEMCARRSGASLPAIGQLTFDHLAPLQKFVNEHCSASKEDAWIYYAVVSVPANVLSHDDEPLGPNVKGPLMVSLHITTIFVITQKFTVLFVNNSIAVFRLLVINRINPG